MSVALKWDGVRAIFSLTIARGAGTRDLAELDHPVVISLPWAPEKALVSKQNFTLQMACIDRRAQGYLRCSSEDIASEEDGGRGYDFWEGDKHLRLLCSDLACVGFHKEESRNQKGGILMGGSRGLKYMELSGSEP